jgi:hypothetical protein
MVYDEDEPRQKSRHVSKEEPVRRFTVFCRICLPSPCAPAAHLVQNEIVSEREHALRVPTHKLDRAGVCDRDEA